MATDLRNLNDFVMDVRWHTRCLVNRQTMEGDMKAKTSIKAGTSKYKLMPLQQQMNSINQMIQAS